MRCGDGWDIYGKEAAGIITSSLTPVCRLIPYTSLPASVFTTFPVCHVTFLTRI